MNESNLCEKCCKTILFYVIRHVKMEDFACPEFETCLRLFRRKFIERLNKWADDNEIAIITPYQNEYLYPDEYEAKIRDDSNNWIIFPLPLEIDDGYLRCHVLRNLGLIDTILKVKANDTCVLFSKALTRLQKSCRLK